MKKHIPFMLLLTIIYSGCKQRNEEVANYFKDVKKITEYESIYSDKNDEIAGIMLMNKYKNILIVNNRSNDYGFSFYDTEKGTYLGSWGRLGRGPDEFFSPGEATIVDSQLVFTDMSKKEIIYVPIEQILNKEENITIRRESYPSTKDFVPFEIRVINNKKIALGAFEEGRFGVLDAENNIVENSSDYPFQYDEVTGIFRGLLFQSRIKSSIEQSKFVISTYHSDIFEIYQITDKGIIRTYLSSFSHIPQIKVTPNSNSGYGIDRKESINGISNIAVTDKFIFFSYSSKSSAESPLIDEVLCFNWDGEKVKKYILPIPIRPMTLCADDEYIYGSQDYEDETVIYKFRM